MCLRPSRAFAGRAVAPRATRLRYTESWFLEYVQPEVLRRGLKIDFDAHNLGFWLPPEKYHDQHPDWYALIDGRRTRLVDHKQLAICTSNEEGVQMLVHNVLEYMRANPALSITTIVQEDSLGMCQCYKCVSRDPDPKDAFRPYQASLTGGRQNVSKCLRYANLVNHVAREVAKEFPGRWVGHTAYSDVIWPPQGVTMEPNIVTRFSTVDRDDAHPISDDSPSPTNRLLFDILRQWKQMHHGKVVLVEAFMGRHLLKSFPYPMAEGICQQWPSLRRLGIEGAELLCWTGQHETYAMQSLAFARSGWEDEAKFDDIFEKYVTGMFGTAADQVRPFFAGLQ